MSLPLTDLAQECKANSTKIVELTVNNFKLAKEIDGLHKELKECKDTLNNTEQYLRVNNVEIVGLPLVDSDEKTAVDLFNNILDVSILPEDIDICHRVPSKRKDKKSVMVCKFLSRKSKIAVLGAKEKLRDHNKNLKKEKKIFLYEHLSPSNRELYIKAAKVRFEKDLWTRNGVPFLRKDDTSPSFKIISSEILDTIPNQ